MIVEKRSSGKAVVECRFNPVQQRWRCHIAIAGRRIGPLFARMPEGADNAEGADAAARNVLLRAIDRRLVDADDIETEGGVPVVHAAGAKGRSKAPHLKAKARAPRAKAKVKVRAKAKAQGRRPKAKAKAMGKRKANAIVGNGKETRALEDLYDEAKSEYQAVGEALKERHLAIASAARQPE